MKADELPTVESGQWGWVLLADPLEDAPRLLWYDDDDIECDCALEELDPDEECGCPWLAACYPSQFIGGPYELIDHDYLRRLPDGFDRGGARFPSTKAGWVYVVALIPDVDLRRVKIGWTTRPIGQRLGAIKTTSPNAILLGLWDADRSDEETALGVADGRIGTSEVFQCEDPWALVARIGAALRGQVP